MKNDNDDKKDKGEKKNAEWRKNCGYSRWGNSGPVERRGQISAPMSLVKKFRNTFDETKRRRAITTALEWVIKNNKGVA